MTQLRSVTFGAILLLAAGVSAQNAEQDLYTSALFRHRRAHVECSCNCWFILSALHGLVDPSAILEPYDKALTDASRSERREWSIGVVNALTHGLGNLAAHTFEVHAGAAYRDFGLVSGLREAGAAVDTPGAGTWYYKVAATNATGFSDSACITIVMRSLSTCAVAEALSDAAGVVLHIKLSRGRARGHVGPRRHFTLQREQ